jgi:hypothetical protein
LQRKKNKKLNIESKIRKSDCEKSELNLKMQTISKGLKFINHKLRNKKEKRKHAQILRFVNKENKDYNQREEKKTKIPDQVRVYPGVVSKTYLRGTFFLLIFRSSDEL